MKVFEVTDDEVGKRLDAYIASHMPEHVSRGRVKDIIKDTGVLVDDKEQKQPNLRVKAGQQIQFQIPEAVEAIPKPEDIPLDIHFEDEHLIVINKPAGMVVHPASGHWSGTLVNALLYHCGDSLSGIGGVRRPGIVHRLDKDTSGLLVVAKTDQAHAGLTAQFMDHGKNGPLERRYLALVWDDFSSRTGSVNAPIGRSQSNRKKQSVLRDGHPEARHAVTHFKVLKTFDQNENGTALASLVECILETGRTHQIRVHMSHIGHPLVGDQEYGKHYQTKINLMPDSAQSFIRTFKRQALHAASLGFEHPVTSQTLRFECDLPGDFAELLSVFGAENV